MFKFLHTADIHLDSPLRGLEKYEDAPVEQIRQATRRAFDNLVDLAVAEKVSFLLIAGDLFDGEWKDYHTGLFFISRMARLRKEGIRVFLVSGNHDAISLISRTLQLPDNVIRFPGNKPATEIIEDIGVAVHGQSYKGRVVDANLAAGFPSRHEGLFNIGLLHTSLNGREGHEPYAPCSLVDLLSKKYDYWALGHVHKFEVVSGDPPVIFPGNIQGRHILETGAKSVTLVTVDDGMVSMEQRAVDVLRWSLCRVDVGEQAVIEEIEQQVRQSLASELEQSEGRALAIRLMLTGTTPLHTELKESTRQLTESIREIAVGMGEIWLENVRIDTRADSTLETLIGQENPFGELLKTLAALDLNPEQITGLVPEISGLKNRLPAELIREESLYLSDSPAAFEDLVADVRDLLIASLIRQGRS